MLWVMTCRSGRRLGLSVEVDESLICKGRWTSAVRVIVEFVVLL